MRFLGYLPSIQPSPQVSDPMMLHGSPHQDGKDSPKKKVSWPKFLFFAVGFCSSAAPHPHHGPELRPPQRHGGRHGRHGGHRLPRDLRAPCRDVDGHDVADRDAGRRGSRGWPGDAEEEPQQGAEWGVGEETRGKWMDL